MNKLLSGLLGALALCAVGTAAHAAPAPRADAALLAAPAPTAPVTIAVFRPDEAASAVQTVQYRRHYRRHHHRRYHRR